MTDKQPEALRLAHLLEHALGNTFNSEAAAELRRLHQSETEGWRYAAKLEQERKHLHEVNQELLEALKAIRNSGYMPQALIEHIDAIATKSGEEP